MVCSCFFDRVVCVGDFYRVGGFHWLVLKNASPACVLAISVVLRLLVVDVQVRSASGDLLADSVILLCMLVPVDLLGPGMPVEAWVAVAVRSIPRLVLR